MQLALATPVVRSVVLGGILFAATASQMLPTKPDRVDRLLVLETTARPHAIYLTAWRNGPLRVTMDANAELRPFVIKTKASITDGCRWLGIETLTPVAKNKFFYSYDEEILDCDPDATPAIKTPRSGIVTVE